jgi:cellobiose phosphorylase
MYRLMLESLLGLKLEAGKLRFAPVLPPEWEGFSMTYRHGDTTYRIDLRQVDPDSAPIVRLDGTPQPDAYIPLNDDGAEHHVLINHPRPH